MSKKTMEFTSAPLCFHCAEVEAAHEATRQRHEAHDCYDEDCDAPCPGFRANMGAVTALEIRAETAEVALKQRTAQLTQSADAFRAATAQISSLDAKVTLLERVLNLVEAVAYSQPAASGEAARWGSPPSTRRWGA